MGEQILIAEDDADINNLLGDRTMRGAGFAMKIISPPPSVKSIRTGQ